MTGYRRIEPAFCRGCGKAWTPGTDACGSCGEAIERKAPARGDSRAVPRVRATVFAVSAVVVVHWAAVGIATQSSAQAVQTAWMGASAAACLLALLAAPLWFPGFDLRRFSPGRASLGHGAAGLVGGGLLALGLVQMFGAGHVLWTMLPSFLADLEDARAVWLGVVVVGIVVEELLFRGILVDGLTGVSGERNAAIASVLLFLVHTLHPFLLLHAAAAPVLRVWSGSPWPGIVLRLTASLGALALLGR